MKRIRNFTDPYGEQSLKLCCRQALIDSGTYRNPVDLAAAIGKDPALVARKIQAAIARSGKSPPENPVIAAICVSGSRIVFSGTRYR